jgi:hypothetical protein
MLTSEQKTINYLTNQGPRVKADDFVKQQVCDLSMNPIKEEP